MPRECHVIVGLAKTGTTAVAMTLRNTLQIADFCMEPRDAATIPAEQYQRLVVKILFDHWLARSDQLIEWLCTPNGGHAPTTIAIVRDPRDEAISRLHYLAYGYFSTRPTTPDDRAAWVDIFLRKEAAPDSLGLIDMENELKARFGLGFLVGRQVYEAYQRFVEEVAERGGTSVHVLRYEDFVADAIGNAALRTLLSGSRNVGPWFRRVHRGASSGDWRHFLTDKDLVILNDLCEPFLRHFDYPFDRATTDPKAARSPERGRLPRETGSDYVAGLIDEARALYAQAQPGALEHSR
jgi:hypothetical protein